MSGSCDMPRLVWERTCDYIIRSTNWQCGNEARINGQGPVVATVSRCVLRHHAVGSDDHVFIVRVRGKEVHMDWTLGWHSPEDMRSLEQIAEKHFNELAGTD